MAIREATIDRYVKALTGLEKYLLNNPEVYAQEFSSTFNISAGSLSELVRAGFIERIGKRQYRRTSKPITYDNVKAFLVDREQGRVRPDEPAKDVPAANDPAPVQSKLDLIPKTDSVKATVSRREFDELAQRVAAMEQLMIRRGVA